MKQEDKELLLKDLYARLPYGVILNATLKNKYDKIVNRDIELTDGNLTYITGDSHWIMYKPYLRPMSNMTEEEKEEMKKVIKNDYISPFGELQSSGVDNLTLSCVRMSSNLINWLIKNHFDYRGLIEKGLAIAVTNKNNPYKE